MREKKNDATKKKANITEEWLLELKQASVGRIMRCKRDSAFGHRIRCGAC